MTFLVGVWAQFYLPPGPTQTHRSLWGRIRGKGWFTEREEVIIVNKVIRDDPTKADSKSSPGPPRNHNLLTVQCTTARGWT